MPSRELTYLYNSIHISPLEKENQLQKCFGKGYVSSLEGNKDDWGWMKKIANASDNLCLVDGETLTGVVFRHSC